MFINAVEEITEVVINENEEIIDYEDLLERLMKSGVILSNSAQEWECANQYLRDHLHHNNEIKDVSKEINGMQNKICEYFYFSETYGQVKEKEINEYENWIKN